MVGKLSEREKTAFLRRHFRVVPAAWKRYLSKLEKGEYPPPFNEQGLRCFVFSECLDVMRKREFDKPFEISVEEKEIVEGRRADLAIGWLDDGTFVAIELKHYPSIESIGEDIRKLHQITEAKAILGWFLMLGPAEYRYEEKLDLKAMGIEEDGKHSCFQWRKIKLKTIGTHLESLMVGIMKP